MTLISAVIGTPDEAVQRLVGQYREDFKRHALHGAADDVTEAQSKMDFAAHECRNCNLAAHLDEQRLQILIFEGSFGHRHLRR